MKAVIIDRLRKIPVNYKIDGKLRRGNMKTYLDHLVNTEGYDTLKEEKVGKATVYKLSRAGGSKYQSFSKPP